MALKRRMLWPETRDMQLWGRGLARAAGFNTRHSAQPACALFIMMRLHLPAAQSRPHDHKMSNFSKQAADRVSTMSSVVNILPVQVTAGRSLTSPLGEACNSTASVSEWPWAHLALSASCTIQTGPVLQLSPNGHVQVLLLGIMRHRNTKAGGCNHAKTIEQPIKLT